MQEFFRKYRYIIIFFISLISINIFSLFYIRSEKYIYFWDFVTYWDYFGIMGDSIQKDPFNAIKQILISISIDDYNYLPVVFLMPFYYFFGDSRLSYILAMGNIYLLPSMMIMTYVVESIIKSFRKQSNTTVFYLNFATILLYWPLWTPLLRGYVGIAGLIIIGIIILINTSITFTNQKTSSVIITGFLLFLLVITRRYYIYWVLGFFIALCIERLVFLVFCSKNLNHRIKSAKDILKRLIILGSIFSLFLIVMAGPVTIRNMFLNVSEVYSAYKLSLTYFQRLVFFQEYTSNLYIAITCLGIIFSFKYSSIRTLVSLLFFQIIVIISLFAVIQAMDVHHFLLLAPSFLIFQCLFNDQIIYYLSNLKRQLIYIISYSFVIILSFSYVLIPDISNHLSSSILLPNNRFPPLVRNDIDEIVHILDAIENDVDSDRKYTIYVLSGSVLFNDSILRSSIKLKSNKPKIQLEVFYPSLIDRRDGFPEKLFISDYIIVANPIQYQFPENFQRVIGIPANMILNKYGIGTYYEKLPHTFYLDHAVDIYIYKRKNEIDSAERKKTLERFVEFYPDWKDKYLRDIK